MGEVNHGWFYIIGLPIFLFLWFWCLTALSSALEHLVAEGRLVALAKYVGNPLEVIANKNRKWMNPIFVFAIPIFIIVDLVGEGKSIMAVSDGFEPSTVWDIGHIQANQMWSWAEFFNNQRDYTNPDLQRWRLLQKEKQLSPHFRRLYLKRLIAFGRLAFQK